MAVGQPTHEREDFLDLAETGTGIGEHRGRDRTGVTDAVTRAPTAASADVSGMGGTSGKRSSAPSTPTNGIRRGTSQGRSAIT